MFYRIFNVLAIINKPTNANTLAVVKDNNSSENLNFVIGGLIVLAIIIVASTLFSKKQALKKPFFMI